MRALTPEEREAFGSELQSEIYDRGPNKIRNQPINTVIRRARVVEVCLNAGGITPIESHLLQDAVQARGILRNLNSEFRPIKKSFQQPKTGT